MRLALDDICLNICDGVHNTVIDTPDENYYLLSAKNVKDGNIIISNVDRTISLETLNRLRKRTKMSKGDVVVTTVGTIGEVALITDDNPNYEFQRSVGILKPNKEIIDSRYLKFVLQSNSMQTYLSNNATGAAQPCLFISFLKKIKVEFPNIGTQRKIAEVLSTYDDLIENNNKRIELLENMAQELYKEWFVRFRFPGHKTAKFENGIPEGWERDKISKYYDTCSGGTPSRANYDYYINGTFPWVKTGEIQDSIIIDTEEYITEKAIRESSAKLLPTKSLAMAMYGVNIGKLAYFDTQMTCNQACCVFSDKRDFSSKHYLFYYLMSIREYLLLIGFGAAQQNLSQDLIRNIKIIMPPKGIVAKFEDYIDNIYCNIKNLMLKNKNLKTQRDLLLPRLMSGKLEV